MSSQMSGFSKFKGVFALVMCLVMVVSIFAGCAKPKYSVVGMWKSDRDGKVIEFKEDGRYVGMKTTNYVYEIVEDKQIKLINKDYADGSDTFIMSYVFEDKDTLVTEADGFKITWKRVNE